MQIGLRLCCCEAGEVFLQVHPGELAASGFGHQEQEFAGGRGVAETFGADV
jgi:hypothetical protein